MRQNCIFVAEICLQMSNMSYKKNENNIYKEGCTKKSAESLFGCFSSPFYFPEKAWRDYTETILKHSLFWLI